jgi:hypothetical protein
MVCVIFYSTPASFWCVSHQAVRVICTSFAPRSGRLKIGLPRQNVVRALNNKK